ncbi:SDR family oxidoreductase [Leptolyngbya sp. FACHB-711]|uniref:SDR family oxidoreductase n=1 Tax=unclassified Leptolyngbya TaxID=2650499 RepID=UPI001686874A|nr:SDR family oxidoreductase [Leptolyngbya sp. FACHB-711]MBD2026673.1 SDR family oxidoreductase [Leptolyngbya sp. FACHB-711]
MSGATSGAVFLAGASRGVGREVAQRLAKQSQPVVALLRSSAAQVQLEALGIKTVMGDALNPAEIEAAMLNQPISAVISTIGGQPPEGQRSDYLGNKNLIDAAIKANVQKFILITSIGAGKSKVALPPHVLEALGPVLAEKDQAEQHLLKSGLTYTIIRPGGLLSEPPSGSGILTPDHTIAGSITRGDVAELVCRCLSSDRVTNAILSAVDRQRLSVQREIDVIYPD